MAEAIYVDANAVGPVHDGSSWCDAYLYLQDALAAAAAAGGTIDEIRVADGVYKPDQGAGQTPGDQAATFQLQGALAIAGGFVGWLDIIVSESAPEPKISPIRRVG